VDVEAAATAEEEFKKSPEADSTLNRQKNDELRNNTQV